MSDLQEILLITTSIVAWGAFIVSGINNKCIKGLIEIERIRQEMEEAND